jgi:NADH:ubiquinone reductase (non-electrogenic)
MTDPRPRLVILGTGFAAFNLLKTIGDGYSVSVVSPRNHFLFTPLLPSTTVGTIEFRSIIEPIRRARRGVGYFRATAVSVDSSTSTVRCAPVDGDSQFDIPYDVLVIAVGAASATFNVPGVREHALFLKELGDARELRQSIIRNFERANIPSVPTEERERLLHFVVCGGGPTGVEFAAELHDFLSEELRTTYPALEPLARITVVDAGKELLMSFDHRLREYAMTLFARQRIQVITAAHVTRVDASFITLADGSTVPYGLLLWSTGNGPTDFAATSTLPRSARSQFLVDERLAVQGSANVYALGDCAQLPGIVLPATAQVAMQQGLYLGRSLRRKLSGNPVKPFLYRPLGMLAYVGGNRALADLEAVKGSGWLTWLFWRSAYLTRLVSLKNKVLVLFDWLKARIFGRDVSEF